MKSILLTGSSGFVGSRLLVALDRLDCSINLLSRTNNIKFSTSVCDFIKNDIPSASLSSIDTVFHLAGYSHDLSPDNKVDHLFQAINIDATIKLAELAVKNNVNHFVFISSVKAAGISKDGECVSEEFQGVLEGAYAKSKRIAEQKLVEISKNSNMRVSIIRPALVYGPNPKGNLELLWNGIKNDRFLPIPKIQNRKSMIHVDDLVNAIILISKNHIINREIFHATDGLLYSSRDIYETMCCLQNKNATKWSIPKSVLKIAALIYPPLRLKVKKLIQDECYSSKKLNTFGFKAEKSLIKMNETNF